MLLAAIALLAAADPYTVDPAAGNSNFSAVFDAPLGERINAISSQVACTVNWDEAAGTVGGFCSVPLLSITVDNEPIKAEHFQQWSTNKKSKPKTCNYEAKFEGVPAKLEANKEVPFTAEVAFTVCGRAREDSGKEKLEGTAMLMPAGSYGEVQVIRIRGRVASFNREAYRVGPKFTDGWLARVQALAQVVSATGTVDLSLFARKADPKEAKTEERKAGKKGAKAADFVK